MAGGLVQRWTVPDLRDERAGKFRRHLGSPALWRSKALSRRSIAGGRRRAEIITRWQMARVQLECLRRASGLSDFLPGRRPEAPGNLGRRGPTAMAARWKGTLL